MNEVSNSNNFLLRNYGMKAVNKKRDQETIVNCEREKMSNKA